MYEAIILAGGFGTRLREAVPDLPKPMAPIAGKPFLAWQLDYLIRQGVTRFILSIYYKADSIRDYFGSNYKNAQIIYAEESAPLGTGGAIQFALTKATQERVFVFNGDTLCDVDLDKMRNLNIKNPHGVSILVKKINDTSRYGSISFDIASSLVTSFGEKVNSGPGYINAGIYDIPKNLFVDSNLASPFAFEDQVIKKLVSVNLFAWPAGEFFIDIGIKSDFINAQKTIAEWFERELKQGNRNVK